MIKTYGERVSRKILQIYAFLIHLLQKQFHIKELYLIKTHETTIEEHVFVCLCLFQKNNMHLIAIILVLKLTWE